ncbi:hypothetical protein RJ639_035447 [Escallonia herrerae]|uniref:Protein OBERON 4 n=1 Tax=Escallonia herrerae TaxID=1293975 RepID=A0AA89BB96_9ASTE|nr:hypothetical protein RJ639_035447 [Escallonia herrerae]
MKRLKSSEDIDSHGEKGVIKDWGRRDEDFGLHRSSSHRSFYYKPESGKKGVATSSSRYDRIEDDRESSRSIRKRPDYDVDCYDRRKSYERYRDGGDRAITSSSPQGGYGADRIHRSESFTCPRRDFPKGVRSERDRSRREGSVSSWRRFGSGKDDDFTRSGGDSARGSRVASDESARGSRVASDESARGSRGQSDDIGKVKSAQGLRDAKSPPCSKDSGSEQSKSVEVKKSEELHVKTGNSSEREEGELEPDPEPVSLLNPVAEDHASVGLDPKLKEHGIKHPIENKLLEDGTNSLCKEEMLFNQVPASEEKAEVGQLETAQDVVNYGVEVQGLQNETSSSGDVTETAADNEGVKYEECARENGICKEKERNTLVETSLHLDEKPKEDQALELEVKAEQIDCPEPTTETGVVRGASGAALSLANEEIAQTFINKGKSVAVSPCNDTYTAEDPSESRGILTNRESDMEGPTRRGFELFFTDMVKKPEKVDLSGVSKHKDENRSLEPLELSLSLPNVLLPINSQNTVQVPGSPSHARSVQSLPSSYRTNSDGFTASMSFSGSHPFSHNPSCSLTHNSCDNYEQSVGSRPLFQGVDWQGQTSDEHKNRDVPMYGILSNGNGFHHQSPAAKSIANGQAVQVQHLRVAEGSCRMDVGLDRQLSFNKQLAGVQSRYPDDIRSPSQSVGSHETGAECSKDKKQAMREKHGGGLRKSNCQNGKEKFLIGGVEFVESIIAMIVSEPLHLMARRFNDMTTQSVACLKDSVRDIILNPVKQWQLSAFQKALENRSDITLEMLLKSHRSQLEILVALRTGLREFLQRNYDISSSDLAEVFLNLRCRNLTCRGLLPVDECECKICVQKKGFCSACMCLLCSKFDMASNTCSWVGCDVCLHWCHADCGLRESYIRNGRSASGAQGMTQMQFHCVACDHPSEMFGFVKEVFQNFVKDWTAETLSKELEYVRRIFCASEDFRGKRLHELAIQLQSSLSIKSDLQEVQNKIISFFAGLGRDESLPGLGRDECPRMNFINVEGYGFEFWTDKIFGVHWQLVAGESELAGMGICRVDGSPIRGSIRCKQTSAEPAWLLTLESWFTEYLHVDGAEQCHECDSFKSANTTVLHGKELARNNQGEVKDVIAESSQIGAWPKSVYSEKAPRLENPAGLLPAFDYDRNDKHILSSDLRRNTQKEPVFDELESIVKIKQAEGKMFQDRADDARREAEGLKRIANAKNEKIEEEYTIRIAKLHLAEAERIRNQKFEELQAIERAHQEYFTMKMRMEADIKDLLLKMEATKRNLTI